jgi:DNA mismatch repair ATPase MutS
MKAHLLYRDRDFDLDRPPPACSDSLVQDLELRTLVAAMSKDDAFIADVSLKVLLADSSDIDTLLYRQHILKDCLDNGALIRELYDLAVEAVEAERKSFFLGSLARYPSSVLYRGVDLLNVLVTMLQRLRSIADRHAAAVRSEGLAALFAMLRTELSDEYLQMIRNHLQQLKFDDGVLISAKLGAGNKGTAYVLRAGSLPQPGWLQRLFGMDQPGVYSFHLADRDETGARALAELKDQGINLVANAAAQSADHILSFFALLRTELAFYLGCLNLEERLRSQGNVVCFPQPYPLGEQIRSANGLYDVCLSLQLGRPLVPNDLRADGKRLIVVTGANQGGKSTFLRAIGIAQLMMQCGMFVPAAAFRCNVCNGVFTHYRREEDPGMESGKFDEELRRMDEIVAHVTPDSMVLFNESFSSTNEREGAEIAQGIVTALIERGILVVFVTHQYELAHGFDSQNVPFALFLRAQRNPDGTRTFKMEQAKPLETSFGHDLYRRIFEGKEERSAARTPGS